MSKPSKTANQVRAEFREAGISVAAWARKHGLTRECVVDLLHGRSKGERGESHRAAVLLGLKSGRIVSLARFEPAHGRPAAAQQPARRRP